MNAYQDIVQKTQQIRWILVYFIKSFQKVESFELLLHKTEPKGQEKKMELPELAST